MIKNSLIVTIMVILISTGTVGISNVFAAAPDAPTNVVKGATEPTSTTISLAWTAPASDGGSPITGYLIEGALEDPNNIGTFFAFTNVVPDTGNVTTYTLTGLTEGAFYNTRISAINADGTGSASTAFQIGTQRPASQDYSGGTQTFGDNTQFGSGTQFATGQTFTGTQDFSSGGQTFGTGNTFAAGQSFTGSGVDHDFGATGMTFGAGASFNSGESFGAATDFSSGAQTFDGNNTFGAGTSFGTNQDFSSSIQTFSGANTFDAGTKFASGQNLSSSTQTFGTSTQFSGNTDFATGQVFGASAIFDDTQVFDAAETYNFSASGMQFGDADGGVTFGAARTFGDSADFDGGLQTFSGANTFGDSSSFFAGQDLSSGTHTFGTGATFRGNTDFATGQVFGAGAIFDDTQVFDASESYDFTGNGMIFGDADGGVDFGAARTFGVGADFDAFTQSFIGTNDFGAGTLFAANQDFSTIGKQNFNGATTFKEGMKFFAGQDFTTGGYDHDFTQNEMVFGAGTIFPTGETFGSHTDFTGIMDFPDTFTFSAGAEFATGQTFTASENPTFADMMVFASGMDFGAARDFKDAPFFEDATFVGANTFGAGAEFNVGPTFTEAQTFSGAADFGANTDFSAVAQSITAGSQFGSGSSFISDGSQSLPASTVMSSGLLLEAITCTTTNCLPSDATKVLAKGEKLLPGQAPAAIKNTVTKDKPSLSIDGLGIELTFSSVTTDGNVDVVVMDPATVSDSTADGADGTLTMTASDGNSVTTLSSVYNISTTGTTANSGTMDIVLPYDTDVLSTNGVSTTDLEVLHYTGGSWVKENNCSVNESSKNITCTVTSLSPYSVGANSSSFGGGGAGSCDSSGFGIGRSLNIYEITYTADTDLVTVKAYSTCGSVKAHISTLYGTSIMGLHSTQDFVGDTVAVYSATIDDEVDKFVINFENRRNTFSETFYLNGNDLIKTYTSTTGYTSTQQSSVMTPQPNESVLQSEILTTSTDTVPIWIKNNAEWWANDIIDDETFVTGIEYLIKEKILNVTATSVQVSADSIPSWIKNNAEWWANDIISEGDFITGIEYLVNNGIISVN